MVLFRRLHETLARVDATIDRNTRGFERNADAFERNADAFERNAEAFERNAEASDRNTRAFERHAEAFDDLQTVIRETRILEERALQRFEATMDRISADVNAHTEAIWRLLDRWGEGPSPAS